MAGFSKAPHLIRSHTFFDALQNVLIPGFVAHQEKPESRILERFNGVVIDVGAAIAGPGYP